MVDKADQARLRELMREAVTMLCKTGLNFESKFSVEGLLGITVDDRDIMLINLNETVLKYENSDSCEDYTSTASNQDVHKDREPVIIEAEPADQGQLQLDDSDSADSLIIAQVNETEKIPTKSVPNSTNKTSKRKNMDSALSEAPQSTEERKKGGFFSPTVDQIIQEYEQQQYSDSSSLLYMARKRRRKYPDHVTELHTQGLLPILPQSDAMISILPKQAVHVASSHIVAHSANASTVKIKKEPGVADPAEDSGSGKSSRASIEPILIEPKTTWGPSSSSHSQSKSGADRGLSLAMIASAAANAAMEDTLWVEDAILKQEGCFVSTRVILRKHGALRGENVVQAMKCMTHQRGDPLYVGEYKQSGRIQVFYKCPPLLLCTKALERYKMTLDQYSNYFFGNPKPNNGTPSQWSAYINTVLDGLPYSPKLFPIESMNLSEEDYQKLCMKRDMLLDRFVGARDDDSVLGGFRVDDTDTGT